MTAISYQEWLKKATLQLQQSGDEEHQIDAQTLLSFVTKKNRAMLFAFGETLLSKEENEQLEVLLKRRLTGEPLAYLLGSRGFWSLELDVSPATLIPRQDTERLVELALEIALEKQTTQSNLAILDLGTGTGAIALALAQELGEKVAITGVDFMPEAVNLAKQNALKNQLPWVTFFESSWFDEVEGLFDVIVSNPPYIDEKDPHLSQGDLRFEPTTALVADNHGFADLFSIIDQAPHFLCSQGWLLLEHGFEQGERLRQYFADKNQWQKIRTEKDYANNERVTLAQLK